MSESYPEVDELLKRCHPLERALAIAFDRVEREGDRYHAFCCGQQVRYWSGIFGTDMSRCLICGSEIRNLFSPHVSPLLLDPAGGCTHWPTEEMVEYIGDREWFTDPKPKEVVF